MDATTVNQMVQTKAGGPATPTAPDSSGTPAAASSGGTPADASTATADASAATPDAGAATPDTGAATPDTGAATPDAGAAAPGSVSALPPTVAAWAPADVDAIRDSLTAAGATPGAKGGAMDATTFAAIGTVLGPPGGSGGGMPPVATPAAATDPTAGAAAPDTAAPGSTPPGTAAPGSTPGGAAPTDACGSYQGTEKDDSKSNPGLVDDSQLGQLILSNFAVGDDRLKTEHRDALTKVISNNELASPTSPAKVLDLVGYTDCVDNEKVNLPLRQERAEAPQTFFESQSVPETLAGTPSPAPAETFLGTNATVAGRAGNRAVKVTWDPGDVPPPQPDPQKKDPTPAPDDDQPDCALAARSQSTEWNLASGTGGALGAVFGGGAFAFTLTDRHSGVAYPLLFVGGGLAGGADVNKGLPGKGNVPAPGSISGGGDGDFTTPAVPVTAFDGTGELMTAGGGALEGLSGTIAELPAGAGAPFVAMGGEAVELGASAAWLVGRFEVVASQCKRADPPEAAPSDGSGSGPTTPSGQ
jgi:outer membrane protein OmpA-like peptidoglycan-associated protein